MQRNPSPQERQNLERKWAQVVARCWADPKFKERLCKNPCDCLAECGIEVPAGLNLCCVEDTANKKYLILPEKPRNCGCMSEGELRKVAAAGCCSSCCVAGSYGLCCCSCCD